jgi:hypothetical protein
VEEMAFEINLDFLQCYNASIIDLSGKVPLPFNYKGDG